MTIKKRLPDFDKMTYEEESQWWETHDTADYPNEFEEVEMKAAPSVLEVPKKLQRLSRNLAASNLESGVRVRLTSEDHQNLRILSDQKGVGMGTLVRMWVREKLTIEAYQTKTT